MTTLFQVFNFRTQQVVGTYKNRQFARNKATKMDLAYGAMTCTVKVVEATNA
jgi:hypothetical protein